MDKNHVTCISSMGTPLCLIGSASRTLGQAPRAATASRHVPWRVPVVRTRIAPSARGLWIARSVAMSQAGDRRMVRPVCGGADIFIIVIIICNDM